MQLAVRGFSTETALIQQVHQVDANPFSPGNDLVNSASKDNLDEGRERAFKEHSTRLR